MHATMASLRNAASSCFLMETTTWSTSSSPCLTLYNFTRRNNAAKQIPCATRQPLMPPLVPWSSADKRDHLMAMSEMHMILEMVLERVEMHDSVKDRMSNLNMLLVNFVNMMTLTATTISSLVGTSGESHFGMNMSAFVLFSAVTGMLVVMNLIQPSQLEEEHRHAARMFKRIQQETRSLIELGKVTRSDVERMMEKILMLDRAYPVAELQLEMIDKFQSEFMPVRWWPNEESFQRNVRTRNEGWSVTLEAQMKDIVEVLKVKDMEEYERVGTVALKLNKMLAITGPALTTIAALSAAFASSRSAYGSIAAAVAVVGGALACAVNSFEHGGKVGMVVEMYRNKVGELKEMEEWIESNVASRRENGEVFEKMVALKLGRSLPELRNLAKKSSNWTRYGTIIDEFASKLF